MSAPTSRRELARRWVGRTLSERYRLERLIGVGGMGAVYAARHLGLDRRVAVKTVLPGMVLAGGGERLLREARAAAKAAGRGVVDVLDVAVDDDVGPYLVMELLEGETLEALLAERAPLPVHEALALMAPVLDTLASLHAGGLVHRDLKPANVFVAVEDGERRVKILDFGLVGGAVDDEDGSLTASGAIVGTPRYMAPEQARGASRQIDARADQFAVGAILYYALGGHKPYEGFDDSDEILELALGGGPSPLSRVAPGVPAPIAAAVERAMATDPADRWSDVGALADALLAAGDADHAPADPSLTASERPRALASAGSEPPGAEPPRADRATAWLAGALALGVVGAGGVFWVSDADLAPDALATTSDAGRDDAGADAGRPVTDAGAPEAGPSDAGAALDDAGIDAAAPPARPPRRPDAGGRYRGRAGVFDVEDF